MSSYRMEDDEQRVGDNDNSFVKGILTAVTVVGVSNNVSSSPTMYASDEAVVLKSLENVREPSLDPRVDLSKQTRPTNEELDEGFGHQLTRMITGRESNMDSMSEKGEKEDEPIYIEFAPGDQRNPFNFPRRKKWAITAVAVASTVISATTSSAYSMGSPSMTRDLNCTQFHATIGLSTYNLGFGVVPLVTASFSEEFGRQPLYIVSSIGVLLMFVMISLAKNIQTVVIARLIQGGFASTGATMVGGTISDIWAPNERGLPMSIFALAGVGGTGLGPVAAGWIEMNPRREWKWIEWIQMMFSAIIVIALPIFFRETRSSILLTRIAKKLRKDTGNHRYRARVEDERAHLRTLIWISCTRPVHLMLTEFVVSSFSLWIGFAWGVTFCLVQSIGGAFKKLHDFNEGQIGTIFLTIFIGALFGFFSNYYQERLYQRHFPKRGPEARLYLACVASIFLPVGMLIYAWSSFKHVPWIALAIGITLFAWGVFIIYVAVFTYLADCYGPFASSALAGQSLARNLCAAAFPLFTTQMYHALDYKWANTLFGCIATLMIPIPFALIFFGPDIRMRSKFSRAVMEAEKKS